MTWIGPWHDLSLLKHVIPCLPIWCYYFCASPTTAVFS